MKQRDVSASETIWSHLKGLPAHSEVSFKTIRAQFPEKSNPDISGGAISGFLSKLAEEGLLVSAVDGTKPKKDGKAFVYQTTTLLRKQVRDFHSKPAQYQSGKGAGRTVVRTNRINSEVYVVEYEGARNKLGVLAVALERQKEKLLGLSAELEATYSGLADLYLQLNDRIEIDLYRIPSEVLFKHLKERRAKKLFSDVQLKGLYEISKPERKPKV